MSEYPSMYDAAIEYAKKGFAVFPLKYRDKVPLTRNGCKDATTDAAQIKAWWQKYPNANIGLATGSVSQNVFVIDLDIDEDRGIDGYHSLEDWQREHGDFPETWTAITGRGGYHLYYRGNGKIKNRAGIIDGVDIRGNGGYVVAPPSIHKNGRRYEWEYSPDEFEIAKADNNVEYFLSHDDQKQGTAFTMPNIVAAGQRNQMLFRFACMMQAKVSELKSKLEELSKVRIETEEYKKLKDDIKALEDEFEKVETKQREWLDMGFSINSAPLQELDKQMDDIWADIDRLQRKQKEMQTTGKAYADPTSTDAYKSTAEKYNVESQRLEHINGRLYSSYNKLKNKVAEYRQKNSRLVQVMQNLQKAAARVGMVVKNMGSALRSAGSAIKSMVSAMKKAVENMFNLNKQTDRSRMSLSRMLGMSLLFSGVFRAISAVSDGVKSGFENLAQYSNSTNSAISSLMSSMTRLKNSFATAFAPVLTVVAPIMSRFIDMISRAITYVGMFAAALTGQDTFVKAVGVQEDYAAGLEKTSKNTNQAAKNTKKANKETEGYLSTLDEIQRYTSNKNDDSAADGNGIGDTGGYTAPTPAQMFKKVPVANSIKGIADKIKKLIKSEDWEGLGKYIASGINKGLKKVYEAISWKKVGPKITKFCDAFTRTFNSLVDNVEWKLLGRTVGAGINTVVNTLNLLIIGIDWKNLGKRFAEGITGLVKEVNWNNLGQLIANRFMITWDIFNGMVHNLPFSEIGKAIADGLNGICSRISFREIADTLPLPEGGIGWITRKKLFRCFRK